jgi:hypothetical protein
VGRLFVSFLVGAWPTVAAAGEAVRPDSDLTQTELDSWLDAEPVAADTGVSHAELDAPLPAPRARGLVVEGSVGALGHLGDMQNVSPVSPWFRLQLGYELFDWLMLFGEGDVALSNTSFAQRPPEKRSYALFGGGLGARLAWQPLDAIGLYLQGDAGLSSVDQDVLATYGYSDADRLRPYVGAGLGVEWFQVSPHYALSVYGGARDYLQNFERVNGTRPPLAWLSGLAIRYTL